MKSKKTITDAELVRCIAHMGLPPHQFAMLFVILFNCEDGACYATSQYLAECLNVTRRRAKQILSDLRNKGLITRKARYGQGSITRINRQKIASDWLRHVAKCPELRNAAIVLTGAN